MVCYVECISNGYLATVLHELSVAVMQVMTTRALLRLNLYDFGLLRSEAAESGPGLGELCNIAVVRLRDWLQAMLHHLANV